MFNKTNLDNGLRVLTKHLPGTAAATVIVLTGAGSRYETQEIRGISHFLEHMFFKGGERFTDTKAVSEAIDCVGGEFNAFTGKEYAGYYVKVSADQINLACDVLSDMLLNATFPPEEIEKERGVILEELNMYQDTPMYQIGWDFEKLLFGDQPLGWDQIGTKELIKTVTQQQFQQYKDELYSPENTVIAIVGNIEGKNVEEMVAKYFGKMSGKKAYDYLPVDLSKATENVIFGSKKTEQAHVAVGFPSYSENEAKHWAVRLLAIILGGNMSSRMFLGVREAHGLAYYIHTSTDQYSDAGAIVTNAGVDVNRVDQAIEAIIAEYKKVLDEGVTAFELEKAKAYFKGKLVLNLEDCEEYAHMLAKFELLKGEAKDPGEIVKVVEAVTLEDVMSVARELFVEEKLKLAVIGPYDDKERFEKLLKF